MTLDQIEKPKTEGSDLDLLIPGNLLTQFPLQCTCSLIDEPCASLLLSDRVPSTLGHAVIFTVTLGRQMGNIILPILQREEQTELR